MAERPQKPKILVIDDRAAHRLAYAVLLERDFDVLLAASHDKARELRESGDIALAVFDLGGTPDGCRLAAELRSRDGAADMPILVTGAFDTSTDDVLRVLAAGATEFVFTPFNPESLRSKVDAYVRIYYHNRAVQRGALTR